MIGLGAGFGPSRLGGGDMANISYHMFFCIRFYHNSLSCCFFYLKLFEHYSQTHFPIIKPFKVTTFFVIMYGGYLGQSG